ncbi:hypothetical protein EXN66_Car020545 [Channa argus]|uniref:Secreted protein n=1 Tax=Channa argus TaxID=215402 RepID=A0A6G1QQM7_CHAAH|nr:hypothetical protein EXN66_Car020545 [Channa argus]
MLFFGVAHMLYGVCVCVCVCCTHSASEGMTQGTARGPFKQAPFDYLFICSQLCTLLPQYHHGNIRNPATFHLLLGPPLSFLSYVLFQAYSLKS